MAISHRYSVARISTNNFDVSHNDTSFNKVVESRSMGPITHSMPRTIRPVVYHQTRALTPTYSSVGAPPLQPVRRATFSFEPVAQVSADTSYTCAKPAQSVSTATSVSTAVSTSASPLIPANVPNVLMKPMTDMKSQNVVPTNMTSIQNIPTQAISKKIVSTNVNSQRSTSTNISSQPNIQPIYRSQPKTIPNSGVPISYEELFERYSVVKNLTDTRRGAKVWLCKEDKTGSLRAVKVLAKDEDLARAYSTTKYPVSPSHSRPKIPPALYEADIIHRMEHPNVVRLIEVLIGRSDTYMILEYYSGGELYDTIIKKNKFNENESKCIMSQLFSVVAFLHSKNIVHRDIKPENILFESSTRPNHIRLVDFGLSDTADHSVSLKAKVGTLVVTAYYVAPEVLDRNYNNKCDVWSCGVILYILLCGYPPFKGRNDAEIISNAKKLKYSFEGEEWRYVSVAAKDLIRKILMIDMNKRISAAEALQHVWFG